MAQPTFPELPEIGEIKARLHLLFPIEFPNRAILVGDTAARAVFVFLYGGFVEHAERFLRPSFIYLFTAEQSRLRDHAARAEWAARAPKAGFRPVGQRWYAGDNSREQLRDDLIRDELVPMGAVGRKSGVPTTSNRPRYFLTEPFATLWDPSLQGTSLNIALEAWRSAHLNPSALSRMRMRAARLGADATDELIEMPDGTRMRLSVGPSSRILKGVIEDFAPRYLSQPAVLWVSASDKKVHPHFIGAAAVVGLKFPPNAELPDLILADLGDPVRFVFCEVVASDGAVTEARKSALLKIVQGSDIPLGQVEFLTAFEDRAARPVRKNFGALADEGIVWFRSEPNLLLRLTRLK